jgi:YggT family protein
VNTLFHGVGWLVEAYLWLVMFPMAILSWFRVEPGTTLARARYFLYRATEPVLRPVRRVIPPMGGIDLSFIVVFLVLQLVVVKVLFSV